MVLGYRGIRAENHGGTDYKRREMIFLCAEVKIFFSERADHVNMWDTIFVVNFTNRLKTKGFIKFFQVKLGANLYGLFSI